jgi:hypothetical protein
MTEFVTIIKKYGVTGLLGVWVWSLQTEVKEMRTMLVDCYQVQMHSSKDSSNYKTPNEFYAVIPKNELSEKTNKRNFKA